MTKRQWFALILMFLSVLTLTTTTIEGAPIIWIIIFGVILYTGAMFLLFRE